MEIEYIRETQKRSEIVAWRIVQACNFSASTSKTTRENPHFSLIKCYNHSDFSGLTCNRLFGKFLLHLALNVSAWILIRKNLLNILCETLITIEYFEASSLKRGGLSRAVHYRSWRRSEAMVVCMFLVCFHPIYSGIPRKKEEMKKENRRQFTRENLQARGTVARSPSSIITPYSSAKISFGGRGTKGDPHYSHVSHGRSSSCRCSSKIHVITGERHEDILQTHSRRKETNKEQSHSFSPR